MTLDQGRYVPAPPVAPGEVLRDRILGPLGITQDQLASALQVSRFSGPQGPGAVGLRAPRMQNE